MDISELTDFVKRRPYVAAGVAGVSALAVGVAWWQGRGGSNPAASRASLGVVGDKTAIDSGYPAVIINQPAPAAPAPDPSPPSSGTGTTIMGYVLRGGKRVGVDMVTPGMGPTCPSGYVAVRRADGRVVCTLLDDTGADPKRYLWFDPSKESRPALKSAYRKAG